jgi:hypothetical protein
VPEDVPELEIEKMEEIAKQSKKQAVKV